MSPRDGGSAFPTKPPIYRQAAGETVMIMGDENGMSLRDYFAAHAPEPPDYVLTTININDHAQLAQAFAAWRWQYADAMLAEREKINR